jgi:uncharacterized protein (DUF1499 family)
MRKILKVTLLSLLAAVLLAGSVLAIEYFGGQPMGLFSGTRPDGLGFSNGQFKPPSWKPNTVSSTVAKDDSHFIEALKFEGDATAAWKKLEAVVRAQKGAAVIAAKPDYLYAEFKTPGLGFVDDVEFALDAAKNVIHVRSGSRLGVRDFGVNRARIEAIRTAFSSN